MTLIAAMTRDRVIGREGRLPWDIPEEYGHFLDLIRGATVIMGRRSYEVFGPDCTCRHLVVVSRSMVPAPGLIVCRSVEDAIARAESLGERVFVAGGQTIYEQTIDRADEMDLSYVDGDCAGDSVFPAFDHRAWTVVRRDRHPRFEFVVYRRAVPRPFAV